MIPPEGLIHDSKKHKLIQYDILQLIKKLISFNKEIKADCESISENQGGCRKV